VIADGLEFRYNLLEDSALVQQLNIADVLQEQIVRDRFLTDPNDLVDQVAPPFVLEALLVASGTEGLAGKAGTQQIKVGKVLDSTDVTGLVGFPKVQIVGLQGVLLDVDGLDTLEAIRRVQALEGLDPVAKSADPREEINIGKMRRTWCNEVVGQQHLLDLLFNQLV
jgi:hypothetical protein